MSDEQRPGDWRVICARSGFRVWASECVKEWTGHYVLRRFVDSTRHPQDMVRGVPDVQRVAWTQPEATDVFVAAGEVTQDDL